MDMADRDRPDIEDRYRQTDESKLKVYTCMVERKYSSNLDIDFEYKIYRIGICGVCTMLIYMNFDDTQLIYMNLDDTA